MRRDPVAVAQALAVLLFTAAFLVAGAIVELLLS